MTKKETVKITPEGLNLLTIMSYSGIAEMNGFANKEVYFTAGFSGDLQYLFQALGNLGAYPRRKDFDKDIDIVVVSNSIVECENQELFSQFVVFLESRLNQNNSPYRRVRFISENHLIWYMENRIKTTNDTLLDGLIKMYKKSKNISVENRLL